MPNAAIPDHHPRPSSRVRLPPELLVIARKQHLAVSGEQATAVLGGYGLRRAVRVGTLVRLWRGAYALPEWPATENFDAPVLTRLAAAGLSVGSPVTACLHTAAQLYGFGIESDRVTHIIGLRPTALRSLQAHRTPTIGPLRRADRFQVVDPTETAVRLAARTANPPRALALLDAALLSGVVDAADLCQIAANLHIDGIGCVRKLIPIADARAESPPESYLRWLCHDEGFPRPEPQFWVRCSNGASYRLDLAWPKIKLALEYDGVEFHTGAALTRDRARYNALTAQGWTVIGVTAPMLTVGRARLVDQIAGHLRRAGAFAG